MPTSSLQKYEFAGDFCVLEMCSAGRTESSAPTRFLKFSCLFVGVDAHIAPAKRTVFSEIFGEFVTALGSMWASTPTNIPEGMQNFI